MILMGIFLKGLFIKLTSSGESYSTENTEAAFWGMKEKNWAECLDRTTGAEVKGREKKTGRESNSEPLTCF